MKHRREVERSFDELLSHALYSVLLHMNTSKPEKTTGLSEYIRFVTNVLPQITMLDATRDEPDFSSSREVSLVKAKTGKVLLPPEIREKTTVFSGDTNFFVWQNDQWHQWKKLERLKHPLTTQEILNEYERMRLQFVEEKNGFSVCWEVALSGINGGNHTHSEYIYVHSKPIDRELFDIYFTEAVSNGMLYSSNARMAFIELLLEAGTITKVSILPYGEKNTHDVTVQQLSRKLDIDLGKCIVKDIVSSVPTVAFLSTL